MIEKKNTPYATPVRISADAMNLAQPLTETMSP